MQEILILLLIGLIVWDVFANIILWEDRKWFHLIPLGALTHLIIKSLKS